MKILILHNFFVERGGEDEVFLSEVEMLKRYGHEVILYDKSNQQFKNFGLLRKAIFLLKDIYWSRQSYREVKLLAEKHKPDIAHIHNIFFMLSPSVYLALSKARVPIVQTLHNFRFICLNGAFYRNGKRCQRCSPGNFNSGILRGCSKNIIFSFLLEKVLRNFYAYSFDKVNVYLAQSDFSKKTHIEAGFPVDKIFVKPNFFKAKKSDYEGIERKPYGLFVGRLVDYKGAKTLISALKNIKEYDFKIIGTGPLSKIAADELKGKANVELLGALPLKKTLEYIKNAQFMIFPTECFESTPRVVIESFAFGVPVIGSDIEALDGLVKEKITGLRFKTGDSPDLENKIRFLLGNKELLASMRVNSFSHYKENYSEESNYRFLMNAYHKALASIDN